MKEKDWRNHIQYRSDFTTRITHLTRQSSERSAFDNLVKILKEKKIKASSKEGYIVGNDAAVCFQDVPILSIAENILYELKNNPKNMRYHAYGLRFNKGNLYQKGARPVFYGNTIDLKKILPESEYWKIVNLDLSKSSNIIDWTHEREWRYKGDLEFEYNEIEILVYTDKDYQRLVKILQEENPEILLEIHGIIPLQSIIN